MACDPDTVAAKLRGLAAQIERTDPTKAQLYRDKADLHAQAAASRATKDQR